MRPARLSVAGVLARRCRGPAPLLVGLLGIVLLAPGAAARPDGERAPASKQPRRVLVLSSFGNDFALLRQLDATFRSELSRESPEQIDFYEVPLEAARFDGEEKLAPFLSYLTALFATHRVDLVVTMGGSAARFAQHYRDRFFTNVPLLYAAVDVRLLDASQFASREAMVPLEDDPTAPVETILKLLPQTTNLAVIIGRSPLERFWRAEIDRALAPYEQQLQITWLEGQPLAEIRRRVAALPPHSAVYYSLYLVDSEGVPHSQERTLAAIHAVSKAPVFGLFDSQIGLGVVGGRLIPLGEAGSRTAAAALRLLAGEAPEEVRLPPVRPTALVFDARELDEWHIPESRLPPGSKVLFRRDSAWTAYRWQILATVVVVGAQSLLIGFFLVHRARRHDAESEIRALHGRLLTAYEQERRRLARELHDDVTQRLARLAIDAAQVERMGTGAERAETLHQMRVELSRLGHDVHSLSRRLHPSILDDLGLVEAVRSEAERFAQTGFVTVDLHLDGAPVEVPSDVGLCIFRVAQEAMRNVQQHSHATRVAIALQPKAGGVELLVTDDGVGFDPGTRAAQHGIGLVGMRERLHLIGGWLRIESLPGHGTKVRAWAPLTERAG